ncbi:hypothetical protein Psed_5755 [Pseudonocardia dioxanivorans CB1190]|uniref:Uncharacterized protein n=1 Tax=Pseudonocardia dioxanivorans (strain ATCC 55486 / DSM 44775 / JCM 13855 / CB1190) TaxID=675635 RepID=F4D194_PSEUX|nr:hypothetical protein [Pseudonocardia dioxanivorans]AEA27882.1 hypothetical protein Psed_5755 [Pseudonocardia dioxanivorans CB1190]
MAWQLTAEIHAHAPRMSLGERAVLLAIAEQARVETRRTPPLGRDELAERAGLSIHGLRSAIRRLRDRGLEVRVPLPGRTSSDGRPMFAVPGVRTTYILPTFESGLTALLTPQAPGASDCTGTADETLSDAHSPQHDVVDAEGASAAVDAAAEPVDNSLTSDDKGGTSCPPAIHKGGTTYPARGVRDASQRGVRDASPFRTGVPVRAGARVREADQAAAVDNSAAPGIAAELERIGTVPPRCLDHADLAPSERPPSCPECASLRREHKARRSEVIRGEARRRRRCRGCDDLGWVLGPDGHALSDPAIRCTHPTVSTPSTSPTSTNTTERQGAHR